MARGVRWVVAFTVLHCARARSSVGVHPPHNPPASWQTWDMARSTISMGCNGSGWSSPERGGQLGIISYDWSNTKAEWAAAKPMNCEENLVKQAEMTKAVGGPDNHVFICECPMPDCRQLRSTVQYSTVLWWCLHRDCSSPAFRLCIRLAWDLVWPRRRVRQCETPPRATQVRSIAPKTPQNSVPRPLI
jgi:hypothetical protein